MATATKKVWGVQKIFTVESVQDVPQEDKNWFVRFFLFKYLLVYDKPRQHTHTTVVPQEASRIRVQIWILHASQTSWPPRPIARGNQLFKNMHIFSQGILLQRGAEPSFFYFYTKHSFHKWCGDESCTNPSVGFQVWPSQVLSRCSDCGDGRNPGIAESKRGSNCRSFGNVKRGMSGNLNEQTELFYGVVCVALPRWKR